MLSAFKARATDETKRRDDATDSEFWVALCFHSREDKEEFLIAHKIDHLGDKYLDGYEVDAVIGSRRGGGSAR